MDLINKRKQEIKALMTSKSISHCALEGFDLCLETLRSAKAIYQDLFGEKMTKNSPDVIFKIYSNLISSETEIAIKNSLLLKKEQAASDESNFTSSLYNRDKNFS